MEIQINKLILTLLPHLKAIQMEHKKEKNLKTIVLPQIKNQKNKKSILMKQISIKKKLLN